MFKPNSIFVGNKNDVLSTKLYRRETPFVAPLLFNWSIDKKSETETVFCEAICYFSKPFPLFSSYMAKFNHNNPYFITKCEVVPLFIKFVFRRFTTSKGTTVETLNKMDNNKIGKVQCYRWSEERTL